MTKLSQISSKTIIIQPGSSLLRIGLATDEKPTVFLHCIARECKAPGGRKTPPVIPRPQLLEYNVRNESVDQERINAIRNATFDKNLYMALNSPESHKDSSNSTHKHHSVPFLRGFRQAGKGCFEIEWPILAGHFSDFFTPSNTLQNLEDMWEYALDCYVSSLNL